MTDEELLDAFPGVRIDADNAAWHRGLLERRLLVNRCDDCGRWHHPPRPLCPACWGRSITHTEVAGDGFVVLVTALRQGPPQPGVDYGDGGHALVAVELDEQPGLRLAGTVVGTPTAEIRVGDRVRALWRDIPGRLPRADFEIVAGAAGTGRVAGGEGASR
ncbi:MAG: zinc ribbon domain-containing protein [Acidimicrobiia bacterium]|nr:zinc ribbon domain-containing protein [Acidimicrobiia bacterium]